MKTVWIIDDDSSIRWVLEKAISQLEVNIECFVTADKALDKLAQRQPDVIVCDIRMPQMSGLEFLQHIQSDYPSLPVIIMTAHSDLDSAVSAYQAGAFDYLPKPFDIDDATHLVQRALAQNQVPPISPPVCSSSPIIGEAPAMQEVFRAIGRLAQTNISVLINGESGTGKELIAHALHQHSPRADKPFIALNMAAIPKDLIETELFGHEKGAFTGAGSTRTGRFQQADGGTLFLDEIGDMPADTQTRLLRVLADGEFYSVGASVPTKVNVRIIAATHQDLEQLVKQGIFREDLYHRLNVIRLQLPRLAQRREDIPMLINHFLNQAAQELDIEPKSLSPKAQDYLCQLDWPGNVRQLQNTCRWISVMASTQYVEIDDLPPEMSMQESTHTHADWQKSLKKWVRQQLNKNQAVPILEQVMPEFERIMIEAALEHTQGKKQAAAKLLGWGRNTLSRKMQE